jgi:predicted nucleotidyltransferase
MRLQDSAIQQIKVAVARLAGTDAEVRLFGSRLDDSRRGGDVDLLVTVPKPVQEPAWLAARLEASISRALDGRNVDVLLSAPNLEQARIHDIAQRDGVRL